MFWVRAYTTVKYKKRRPKFCAHNPLDRIPNFSSSRCPHQHFGSTSSDRQNSNSPPIFVHRTPTQNVFTTTISTIAETTQRHQPDKYGTKHSHRSHQRHPKRYPRLAQTPDQIYYGINFEETLYDVLRRFRQKESRSSSIQTPL